ncbi:hypothetical protein ACIRXL_06570 [Avibacterium paragallinarum]
MWYEDERRLGVVMAKRLSLSYDFTSPRCATCIVFGLKPCMTVKSI